MANRKEVMSPEIRKRPMGFRHLGSSPFCEGESQTLKLPLMALFTQQTSVFGFVCSTKRKGLGTNLGLSRDDFGGARQIHTAVLGRKTFYLQKKVLKLGIQKVVIF